MDQNKQTQDNAVHEMFERKLAGLACLWAIVYTAAGRIGLQIPEAAGEVMFFLQAAIITPVMAALRMTYRNTEMDRWVRSCCRILFGVMAAALVVLLVMAFK